MSKIALTTDAVIFTEKNAETFILLVQRKNEPHKAKWALPGGFLEENETLKNGCRRELKEETGLVVNALEQVGIYDAIGRDPRGRIISVAFTAKLEDMPLVNGSDDAADAQWRKLEKGADLAFDHDRIIADAKRYFE